MTMGTNDNENYGEYKYQDKDTWLGKTNKIVKEVELMEELATVGISYFRPDGSFANAAEWKMTENALRKEHGYGRRVDY